MQIIYGVTAEQDALCANVCETPDCLEISEGGEGNHTWSYLVSRLNCCGRGGRPRAPRPEELANAIIAGGLLPARAFADALHIAVATVHDVDYLITWNCAHIANAEILPRVGVTCARLGLTAPFVCTPDELLGEEWQ